MKRRQLLVGLGVSTLAAPLLRRPGNAQNKDVTAHEVEYRFVQYASESKAIPGWIFRRVVRVTTE